MKKFLWLLVFAVSGAIAAPKLYPIGTTYAGPVIDTDLSGFYALNGNMLTRLDQNGNVLYTTTYQFASDGAVLWLGNGVFAQTKNGPATIQIYSPAGVQIISQILVADEQIVAVVKKNNMVYVKTARFGSAHSFEADLATRQVRIYVGSETVFEVPRRTSTYNGVPLRIEQSSVLIYTVLTLAFGDYHDTFLGTAPNVDLLFDGGNSVYMPRIDCIQDPLSSRCIQIPRGYFKVRLDQPGFEIADSQIFLEAGEFVSYVVRTVGATGPITWKESTGLPPGLTFANGVLSGVIPVSTLPLVGIATYLLLADASLADGQSDLRTIKVSVYPSGRLSHFVTPVIEFYNTTLGHYFRTINDFEVADITNGRAGPGWVRTYDDFGGYLRAADGPSADVSEVCRFYGTPGRGPNSHFYTINPTECDAVKGDLGWTYEAENKFYMIAPGRWGSCPSEFSPVYRAYNNGFAKRIDSNHRYTTNWAVYQSMLAGGWIGEGVEMCAPN